MLIKLLTTNSLLPSAHHQDSITNPVLSVILHNRVPNKPTLLQHQFTFGNHNNYAIVAGVELRFTPACTLSFVVYTNYYSTKWMVIVSHLHLHTQTSA